MFFIHLQHMCEHMVCVRRFRTLRKGNISPKPCNLSKSKKDVNNNKQTNKPEERGKDEGLGIDIRLQISR